MIDAGGDVSRFLSTKRASAPATSIGTINNHGTMAVASTNVTQHTTVGFDAEAMGQFVQMLLNELPSLQLGATEDSARRILAEAQTELARAAPERNKVANALGKFAGYIAAAGQPVLTAFMMTMAMRYGIQVGQPPAP
jgi:hypothetical protein